MGEPDLFTSKPLGLPPYRRSHLRSQTYLTLVRIFSCLPASPDNGCSKMPQENQDNGSKFSEFVGSDSMDSKFPVPQKTRKEVHETIEGVGDKDIKVGANNMSLSDLEQIMEIEEADDSSKRELQYKSAEANDFNEQQSVMGELQLAVKGAEDLAYKSGLIPSNAGLGAKQNENNEVLNVGKDRSLLNSSSLEDKHENQSILEDKHESQCEDRAENLTCEKNALKSSNISIDKESMEEGEIAEDIGMDDTSFDMSSAYSLITQQKKVDEVQMPHTIGDWEKKLGWEPNSLKMNGPQDGHNNGQVEETNFTQNQVGHKGMFGEDANTDHDDSSSREQVVNVSIKKKKERGLSEARKAKRKRNKRKKKAEKNKELGASKRMKLPLVQKPKTVTYCRHYLLGRCHEGDKCHFSHDTVPLTKSKPCCHFARQTCMKGDGCPFDHQLSKYPCDNFVSKRSCSRGDACLFSHQLPTKEDILTASRVCRPELKSTLLPGNASSSVQPNCHGLKSVQKIPLIGSFGIPSHINSELMVTSTVQKQHRQLTPVSKGFSSVIGANSPLPSPSTPNQGMIPPNKGRLVQIGACDQQASGSNQTLKEIPKKLPAVAPKGINFLSFGKGSVCSFKSSINSLLNGENGSKLPQSVNFGLFGHASSSLNKDDYNKAMDGTTPSIPQTDFASNEIFDKSQSMAERIKSSFPGKALIGDAATDLQGSLQSTADQHHTNSISIQEQSLECLAPKFGEHTSKSGQRAVWSTLAFAAEHETDIKMKDPAGVSPV